MLTLVGKDAFMPSAFDVERFLLDRVNFILKKKKEEKKTLHVFIFMLKMGKIRRQIKEKACVT